MPMIVEFGAMLFLPLAVVLLLAAVLLPFSR